MFSISEYAISWCGLGLKFAVDTVTSFFDTVPGIVSLFVTLFVVYTVCRVFLVRILGGALGAVSDAVRGPRVVRHEHYRSSDLNS